MAEYHEARNEHEALRRRAEDLQARRDRSEGGARIERIDELAGMRRDMVLAEKRLLGAREAVREAREKNKRTDPGTDEELLRLQAERAELEPIAQKWLDSG